MIYRVRAEQGLLVLNFDAEGYYAVDDHMNALDAYGEKDKLYVKVDSPTKYVYLIKFKEKGYPKDDVFTPIEFKVVKYEDCKKAVEIKEFNGVLINNENNSSAYLYSKKKLEVPFYVEVNYCYEGKGDNFLIGLFTNEEPNSSALCNGKLLGGCERYYAKGSYAIGFNPVYSKNLIFVDKDGSCYEYHVNKDLTGCNVIRIYAHSNTLFIRVDEFKLPPISVKGKSEGFIYIVGNSGTLSSIQRVNYVRVYEGEIREINGIEKVGYNEVEIRNFRGIEYGNLHLDRVNVIIGANNAGKTTILDALYLLSDPYQKPPGFKNSLELLSYLHNVKKGNKFLYRFYNTEVSPRIKGDEIEVDVSEIFSKSEEGRKEIKTLYMSYRLIPRYLKFIKENWEEISNYTEIFREIFDEVNEISNEEYLTMSLEPFAGEYTFYLIRKDGKRVRLNDIGEGVRIFIVNRILYEYLKPGLLLWDDIEAHLNPALLGKITAWFTDIPSQVVVTTHNLYVAYEISKDGKCIAVDLKNGQLKVKEIEDLKRYLDTGIDPRKIV